MENNFEHIRENYEIMWNEHSPEFIGETPETLKKKYEEDEFLNNIEIQKWRNVAHQTYMNNKDCGLTIRDYILLQKLAAIKFIKSIE